MALDDMSEGFLQVTNHKEHPTNKAYKVFFFYSQQECDYFASFKRKSIFLSEARIKLKEEQSICLLYEKQILKK